MRIITASHLKYKHNGTTTAEYQEMFPNISFKAPEVEVRVKAEPIKYTITCLNCGKTLTFEKPYPAAKEREFCSSSCSSTYHNLKRWSDPEYRSKMLKINIESHNTPEYLEAHIRKQSTFTCVICGIKFKKDSGQGLNHIYKTCSKECLSILKSQNRSGENNPAWKGGLETINCLNCQQEFEAPPSSNRKFCSQDCWHEYWQKNPAETPNWQGGISNEPYPFDFDEELKEYIRNRDSRRCQLCNLPEEGRYEKHHIHHINYEKDDLTPKNLISLCRGCHAKVHGKPDRPQWQSLFEAKIKEIYSS